jgi:murein DD-endopeptidase MepM/ murein hydrolase activator NlpD
MTFKQTCSCLLVLFLPCISFGAAESPSANTLELVLRPTHVYKTPDRSHENTESWIFSLMAQVGVDSKLSPAGMKITLLSQSKIVRTVSYPAEGLKALTYHPRLGPKLPDGTDPKSPIFWPFAIRLRQTEPVKLGVDAMRIEIDAVEDEGGKHRNATVDVPIETYHQKCSLVFPFVGKGIILQGGATNGGHRNRSGAFAIDACGLDEAWSIVAPGPGKQNADYRGWGREIIAPADGVVVRARNDRPDQPVADVSDPKYYAPEYKDGGDVGNYLVIDHGNSEYSMMAHFQEGSIVVKVGDRVHRGQALGKLGHSGDTDGPHLHYQLQAGPDWENVDALPCKFTNVDQALLDRGTYFEAK